MKQELRQHLTPVVIFFLFISAVWLFNHVDYPEFFYLFFGLVTGSFILDLDHFLYWLVYQPQLEESQLAKSALKKKDWKTIIKLLEITHQKHTSLVFHHYFFQVTLVLLSFFVFTSSQSVFAMSFLLSLHLHLLVDEFADLSHNPAHLQSWLFAREKKQLTQNSLKHYVLIFSAITALFSVLLINSR